MHGTKATGKSLVVFRVLNALEIPHIIVRSRECITDRHLLERTVLACKQEVEKDSTVAFNDIDGRCESLSMLTVALQRLLEFTKKFAIVFDGVDKQREAPVTFLPALARLGELVRQSLSSVLPGLTSAFILDSLLDSTTYGHIPSAWYTLYDWHSLHLLSCILTN